MASSGKRTRGRQKIEMKIVEKLDNRLITFSKRRSGIYKKISEISTLCGTDILFICFSPTGKPFSFGHPSIESITNRFLNHNIPPLFGNNCAPVEAQQMVRINKIIQLYNEVVSQLDASKNKKKVLPQQANGGEENFWWETPISELNLKELEDLDSRYIELLNELYITRSKMIASTTCMPTPRVLVQLNPFTPNKNEDVNNLI
ncbi:hypothetical protein GQ457_09G021790 [Hibiscus cannabinus]